MTLSLAHASLKLFEITNRPSESLWTPAGEAEADLRSFIRGIDEDLELVNNLVDESVKSMGASMSATATANGGVAAAKSGGGDDSATAESFITLIADLGAILTAIDVIAAAIDDARIEEVEAAPEVNVDAAAAPPVKTSTRLLDRLAAEGSHRHRLAQSQSQQSAVSRKHLHIRV